MNSTAPVPAPGPSWIEGFIQHAEEQVIWPMNCWAFQLGMLFIGISLFQSGELRIRVCLLLSAIFLIVFGSACLNISIATILWNIFFAIIQVRMLIPLVMAEMPPKLSSHELDVYYRHFKHLDFSRHEFKILLDQASPLQKSKGGTLISQGAIAKLLLICEHNGYRLVVEKDGKLVNKREGQKWLGIVCFCKAAATDDFLNGRGTSQNSFALEHVSVGGDLGDYAHLDAAERLRRAFRREALLNLVDDVATYYEWTHVGLMHAFEHPVHGQNIKAKLCAGMFYAVADLLEYLDDLATTQNTVAPYVSGLSPLEPVSI